MERKATENLGAALGTKVEGSSEEGWGRGWWGGVLDLESTGLLTQEADPVGTTLVDARNGFNDLICLTMLWTVCHRWPEGARFSFNCYNHWAQITLHQP